MNSAPTIQELIKKLRLPAQSQTTLNFCQSNRASRVAEWASQLQTTRINNTSVLLYQALPEICRLDTPPSNRLDILERLRPYVQQCIQGLSQTFLGQPVILPESAKKAAVIAQALQKHLSNGYCLVIRDLLLKNHGGKLKDDSLTQLGLAIHRAISGIGLQFLRNSQIYTQISSQLWLELNTLFYLAEQLSLSQRTFADPLLTGLRGNTIEQAYLRTLLLQTATPNQLRQNDVQHLYEALENWCRLVDFAHPANTDNNLYSIDLESDQPPSYRSQTQDSSQAHASQPAAQHLLQQPLKPGLRVLNLTPLLDALRNYASGAPGDLIQVPGHVNAQLLQHVRQHWGEEYHRNHPRKASKDLLEVVVGLTNVHYHLADQKPFNHFLQDTCQLEGQSGNRFEAHTTPGEFDPWAESFNDAGGKSKTKATNGSESGSEAQPSKFRVYQVQISNASDSGYGLEWRHHIPSQAAAGELIALRQPNRRQWKIGVIRWVKQHRGMSKLGVQLIAQQANAIAVQQLQTTGADNVLMRGLITSQAGRSFKHAALITASHPFRTQNKVRMNQLGATSVVQLQQILHSSSSISVFGYRPLETDSKTQQAPTEGAPVPGVFPEDW
ncbi:hypothetical protein G8770_15685 [Aestuariicella hydrocarbonica]|uniref:GTPase n=1 Tax=Pseudomaricurvus hydrocarbonicus TaxID=1470433 RepID=A0A9E5K193_9GAMM|nr:hypothetical protein [Aestuariicella hydrocarbonica]NHO66992.1 hypothetical protein [Aestuariicella hydrocarbonica]